MIASKRNGPKGEMLEAVNRDFETFANLKLLFKTAATTQFGSGFTWASAIIKW